MTVIRHARNYEAVLTSADPNDSMLGLSRPTTIEAYFVLGVDHLLVVFARRVVSPGLDVSELKLMVASELTSCHDQIRTSLLPA